MVIKETFWDRVFNAINITVLCLLFLIMVYPLYFVVIASISNPDLVLTGKVLFYPRDLMFNGFQMVFRNNDVWYGYRNSIFYASAGTLIKLSTTLPAAYAMSRSNLRFKNALTTMFMIPMFIQGGLIPTYILYTNTYRFSNTIWPMILPGATSLMAIVIARTFFASTIPEELHESAEIDGASHFRIFFTIILPLSTAIIAVQALQNAVAHWNAFFNAMLYITGSTSDGPNLVPLQLVLRRILIITQSQADIADLMADQTDIREYQRKVEQIKYALIIVSVIPILIVYPFVQKYFVKGVMIGAIKG